MPSAEVGNAAKPVVVFAISEGHIGGAQTWVANQAKLLEGSAESVLITGTPGVLYASFKGRKFLIEGMRSLLSVQKFLRLTKLVAQIAPAVIVASSAHAGLYFRIAGLLTGTRCIYVSHGWSAVYNARSLKRTLLCAIERWLSWITHRVLCVSRSDLQIARDVIRISTRKLVHIPNGIHLGDADSDALAATYAPVHLELLFLGRFMHPKRQDLAARAVLQVEGVTLTCVGVDDSQSHEVAGVAALEGAQLRLMPAEAPFRRFSEFHALILISESEGHPYVVVEAISHGLPVIVSNVGGCSELVTWGNGLLVKNEVASIADAIRELKVHYAEYRAAARVARRAVDISKSKIDFLQCYGLAACSVGNAMDHEGLSR